MTEKDEFGKAMLDYIAELEVNSAVSRSHFTLHRLYHRFGKQVVKEWLNNHFDNN
tara:strand:- start:115 stop:279 length:165 start_codon:yes stop_codon:yes gene_type:complete